MGDGEFRVLDVLLGVWVVEGRGRMLGLGARRRIEHCCGLDFSGGVWEALWRDALTGFACDLGGGAAGGGVSLQLRYDVCRWRAWGSCGEG